MHYHLPSEVITLHRFTPADRQGVIDVILPIQNQEFGIAITAEQQPDLSEIPAFYQQGYGDFWLAKRGEEVVGTLGLKDIGNRQAALRKMFVKQTVRGREHDVAARLLDILLQHTYDVGVKEIYLGTTAKFLAAHRFYEKHGFQEIEVAALPAAFPLMAVDTKFYLRKVKGPV